MVREITIGQYYKSDSLIHNLDARTKLFATFTYIIMLFLCNNIFMYGVAAIVLAIVISISRVPFSYMVRGLKAIMFLLLIMAFFNVFFTNGKVLFQIGFIKITYQGIIKAFYMSIRFILLILGSSMLTLTTTPNNLTDALERSLGFLRAIKVPVHEIAMMMSIALRFIPILMEETDKIIKAQTARGADFETGGLIRRAKAMIPILIPLFISAFRRANDLATAMDARCYHGGSGRTKMFSFKYSQYDVLAYLYTTVFIIILTCMRLFMN